MEPPLIAPLTGRLSGSPSELGRTLLVDSTGIAPEPQQKLVRYRKAAVRASKVTQNSSGVAFSAATDGPRTEDSLGCGSG